MGLQHSMACDPLIVRWSLFWGWTSQKYFFVVILFLYFFYGIVVHSVFVILKSKNPVTPTIYVKGWAGGLVDICKDAMNHLYREEKVTEE